MKKAIQRRTIYLEPPRGMDLLWVSEQFQNPEINNMFALGDDVRGWHVRAGHRLGTTIVGIVRRVDTQRRIGFACMLSPVEPRDWWELLAAIPDPRHRDAFAMMHTVDIIAHYMFDHLGHTKCGSRVRVDNLASLAVGKRLGHKHLGRMEFDGQEHVIFGLDPEAWRKRREKLEEGERRFPSGTGGAFVTLEGPPYQPVPMAGAGEGTSD